MKALDIVLDKVEGAKVEVVKEGDIFSATLYVNVLMQFDAHAGSMDKALWELNGLMVEHGMAALITQCEAAVS